MKYQLHLNRRQKLICLLYLICVLFAGLIIGFSIQYDRKSDSGGNAADATGINWEGYVSGSLEIQVLTEPTRKNPRGTVTIYSSTDYAANNLVIPDTIELNGKLYDLVQIGNSAFNHNDLMTGSLTIGNNIHTIGDHAFYSCANLNGDLIIPPTVTSIGRYAFAESEFTGTLIIPKNCTLNNLAFGWAEGFTKVIFPNNCIFLDNPFYWVKHISQIVADGFNALPTNWSGYSFSFWAVNNGTVQAINSHLTSGEILTYFKEQQGLPDGWTAI